MTKTLFSIDLAPGAASALDAHAPLARVTSEGSFHTAQDMRQPLGIYNHSVSRVCDKVTRMCGRLEAYFRSEGTLEPREENDEVMQLLVDCIELSLYAAAEHVDDIDSIAAGYFEDKGARNRNPAYRKLTKEVKRHKRLVSAAANAIKHEQSRISVFSLEFVHGGSTVCLPGYFMERVEGGVVCPSRTLHQTQDVFSITTLAWEILLFLLNCSRDLAVFVTEVDHQMVGPVQTKFEGFQKSILAAARLPLYTFGEDHPFSRATFKLWSSSGEDARLDSGLYGSIRNGWSKTSEASVGKLACKFVGDGVTKSFRFTLPKSVELQHWD